MDLPHKPPLAACTETDVEEGTGAGKSSLGQSVRALGHVLCVSLDDLVVPPTGRLRVMAFGSHADEKKLQCEEDRSAHGGEGGEVVKWVKESVVERAWGRRRANSLVFVNLAGGRQGDVIGGLQ